MTTVGAAARTALYRCFAVDGDLLYVGITSQPAVRFASHRDTKPWWSTVARTRLEWFADRSAAECAEVVAITNENPRWNKAWPDRAGHYRTGTGRAKWTPPNGEVAARIDAAVRLFREQQRIEAEYKAALARLAAEDGDSVPIAHLAERLGVERKTVYRHLGRSMA